MNEHLQKLQRLEHRLARIEDEIDDEQAAYLRSCGWEYTCDVPGAYWLWTRILPNTESRVLVPQGLALAMQKSITELAELTTPERLFENRYRCPGCGHVWTDQYECGVDDECPECGLQNISPEESIELDPEDGEPLGQELDGEE